MSVWPAGWSMVVVAGWSAAWPACWWAPCGTTAPRPTSYGRAPADAGRCRVSGVRRRPGARPEPVAGPGVAVHAGVRRAAASGIGQCHPPVTGRSALRALCRTSRLELLRPSAAGRLAAVALAAARRLGPAAAPDADAGLVCGRAGAAGLDAGLPAGHGRAAAVTPPCGAGAVAAQPAAASARRGLGARHGPADAGTGHDGPGLAAGPP
mmetsp:Transcript_37574/g.87788  ORF Transcript_37574/g.87788 Transcript_37574/m.87788 type:complete len:209 (-) Transcript_37574:434-1060(-)